MNLEIRNDVIKGIIRQDLIKWTSNSKSAKILKMN